MGLSGPVLKGRTSWSQPPLKVDSAHLEGYDAADKSIDGGTQSNVKMFGETGLEPL
jgi:hypothetical protein